MLTPPQRRSVATGWGRAVAGLHAVRAAAFTGHPAGASWAEVVAARVEKLVAAHSVAGVLDPGTAAAVRRRVCVAAGEVALLVRPVFTHLDLHLPNIVVHPRRGWRDGLTVRTQSIEMEGDSPRSEAPVGVSSIRIT